MKTCSVCHKTKKYENFGKHSARKDGMYSMCKECRSIARSKYDKRRRSGSTEKYYRHKDRMHSKKRDYGIGESEIRDLLDQQRGCCKICNADFGMLDKNYHVDHDHTTKEVRGLLCPPCNLFLGKFEKYLPLMPKIIEYINL